MLTGMEDSFITFDSWILLNKFMQCAVDDSGSFRFKCKTFYRASSAWRQAKDIKERSSEKTVGKNVNTETVRGYRDNKEAKRKHR